MGTQWKSELRPPHVKRTDCIVATQLHRLGERPPAEVVVVHMRFPNASNVGQLIMIVNERVELGV